MAFIHCIKVLPARSERNGLSFILKELPARSERNGFISFIDCLRDLGEQQLKLTGGNAGSVTRNGEVNTRAKSSHGDKQLANPRMGGRDKESIHSFLSSMNE